MKPLHNAIVFTSIRFSSSRKDTTAGASSPRVSARISASVLLPPTLGMHQAHALQRTSKDSETPSSRTSASPMHCINHPKAIVSIDRRHRELHRPIVLECWTNFPFAMPDKQLSYQL